MRRCPECYAEFEGRKRTCSDCNIELVEDLEMVTDHHPKYQFLEMEYITTASSEMNANIMTSMLEDYQIRTMRKYREAGGYLTVYMGDSCFGIDLYADKNYIFEAKQLITPIEQTDEMEVDISEEGNTTKKLWQKIFIGLCILLFLF